MRRRKKKGADLKLLSFENLVLKGDEIDFKGNWNEKFQNDNPIHVEFGTGRGKFLTTLAKQNPNINYIAMEMKEEVLLKAVEKAVENELNNILFIWGDVNNILDYFDKGELSRVYINFCDPWPKKRWYKRRLTYRGFLENYKKLLKDDGEIHFKTDNEKLFEFSLNEFSEANLKLKNITLDLANSDYEGNVTTEYEDKFMSYGMKIYRLEGLKI
ncbi:tRNA guanine-N(7(-methyltransferase [[Clostridium] sordellii]|uniref:tRNA (guanine-N(7)-)-methyltransferase n=1 Tax=Paraclostridium sordellii TaxID=1505 RepID=A0ABM9RP12_PARSO|nr:tRNA (guanosine(46)-N7)-methyltransferase TrmB [Paeniclostridium sordellii]CEJ73774.1 transfer RNA (guanine-N(7)-)-methyltransferase (tRNA(m7G46)-methyltransferase) [[Clostridium] sordellii] [Paeniclostridium sordellii]CEN69322.1 tRNA guanine-N(7)-methyltransferase [[Clostridium] sordellii] [Paeniclostridium sordellii]CEN72590.1 tRNA guanine-N(7)-methyltransferase [[Clostridium] sordellii] [Paeniclostridium sordellii]CEO24215.1 tRNA guanine-N(7)-methyltransferase [[Clostridium] sordellii] [P